MPNQSLFFDLLNNSRIEQVPVTIFLTSHLINGIVANLNNDTVELRIDGVKRCVVALDRIEAISIA
jgi:sRNA-binding regulator protein Hfq